LPVFISHSHEDQAAYSALCRVLDGAGVSHWDVSRLLPGQSLAEQLRAAIGQCAVCIFLATPRSITRAWCLAELGAFWGAGKSVLIYLADPVVGEDQLPPQFRGTLWTKSATKLVAAVTEALSASSSQGIDFLSEKDSAHISDAMRSAERISILGATLSSAKRRRHLLEVALKKGCVVRILVTDSTPDNLAHLQFRSYWARTSDAVATNIDINLDNLGALRAEYSDTFLIRKLPIPPTYAMTIIEGPGNVACAQVKLLTLGKEKVFPRFEITGSNDTWFAFFRDQYKDMWNRSRDFPA